MTRIKHKLKMLKITQIELSKRLQVSRAAVSIALRDGIKKRSTAERYAKAIGCDWKDILD